MFNTLFRRTVLLAVLLVGTSVFAADAPAIAVTQAWARATPPGADTGAAYFTISNNSSKADAIIGAASTVAADASVHEMKMAGGMMQMRAAPNLAIAPKAKVTFTPNGYHVMLNGLKAPLKEGDRFKLDLQLQHAGKIEVDVIVEGFGASQFTPAH